MPALVLLGGGGHASDVLAVVEALTEQGDGPEAVHIADDRWLSPQRFDGRSVPVELVGSIADGAALGPYVAAVGFPAGRRAVHQVATDLGGVAAAALVHPASSVGTTARLAPGVVVMGQVWLSPGVDLAAHCHVGYGATIGHDTRIGPFSSIMPGARIGGGVVLGDGVLVEAGAVVMRDVTVGDGAVIGPGAVVTGDLAPGAVVAPGAR